MEMAGIRPLLMLAAALRAYGQAPEPDAAAQTAIVSRIRDAALAYSDQLQDFICSQTTTRSADPSGTGKHWKPLETRELELAYVAHKEKYRLLSVNGQTDKLEKRIKKGYFIPGGEFGSSLRKIFGPKAAAEFTWDHVESSDGPRVCVLRYRVPQSTTTLVMQADADTVPLAHGGMVRADCDTGAVMYFHIESEPASIRRHGLAVAVGVRMDVRYSWVKIGEKEFLLPASAEEVAIFGKGWTKAEIKFDRYRKYDSSSTITFGEPPKK